jgi:hypothetical protein
MNLIAQIETDVRGHLIIATAGGVKLGSGITDAVGQLLLDIHVDILEIDGELEFSLGDFITDLIEPLLDRREFILTQKPGMS